MIRVRESMFAAVLLGVVLSLALGCGGGSGSSGDAKDVSGGDMRVVDQVTTDAPPADVPKDVPPDQDTCCEPDAVKDLPPDVPAELPPVEIVDETPDLPPPCTSDEDCDDQSYCTTDTCVDGYCLHQSKSCNDANKCTDDSCDPATGQCKNIQSECDDGDSCTLDSCMPTSGCKHEPIPDCCPAKLVDEESFEQSLEWTVVDEVTAPGGVATWQLSNALAHSGTQSLYFGNLEKKNYDVGGRVKSVAETAPIVLSSQVATHVHFWVWMDLEPSVNYDTFSVYVKVGDTQIPVFAKKSDTLMKKWEEQTVNLQAFVGQTITLRFVFDSLDGNDNSYEGVYVDDVALYEMCPVGECVTKVECNDDLPCTQAHCVEGQCAYSLLPSCCLNLGNCMDDDPCTINSCNKSNVCETIELAPPFCCYKLEDCDDGNKCTADICDPSGICLHPPSTADGC